MAFDSCQVEMYTLPPSLLPQIAKATKLGANHNAQKCFLNTHIHNLGHGSNVVHAWQQMPPPSCAFHLWTWATLDLASAVCTVPSKINRLGMVILLSFSPFPRRHPLCRWHFRQGLGSDKSSYVEIYHYQSFFFTSFAIWFIFNTKE